MTDNTVSPFLVAAMPRCVLPGMENAFKDTTGLEVAQAGVEFVPDLGGAAHVKLLDDMWTALQHEHHHAFELNSDGRTVCILPSGVGWLRLAAPDVHTLNV